MGRVTQSPQRWSTELMVEEEEEVEYAVEKILKQRVRKGEKQFFVKWLGYDDPKDNTWEPLEHVDDTVAMEEWLLENEKGKAKKEKEKSTPKRQRRFMKRLRKLICSWGR